MKNANADVLSVGVNIQGRQAAQPSRQIVNLDAILALWRRQLSSMLLNPLGYVFILAFVLVSAGFLFLPDAYYARNITDLGPLHAIMPWLLVVLLPSLAMGSWASERELGTEEHLLTLPLSVADAILGKWLGVVSFFTLALLCSLSNVAVLSWLGEPDKGMVLANYVGWWLCGLAFAALSILASVLVPLSAIAFVLGALLCAGELAFLGWADWFDPFNRGLVPLGGLALVLVLSAVSLGVAALAVSSRRWQAYQRPVIAGLCVTFVASAVTLSNLAVQADRRALDWDATEEHLSSLNTSSLKILEQIEQPVLVTAFISASLPPELSLKGKEVENVLKVLERNMGGKVELKLYHPTDVLDEAGAMATKHFGLNPRRVVVETVTGRETNEVFLGVVVRSGARTQKIEHFDPGLSVEYELVRAIRTVGTPKKKVVGIASTDLKLTGGFDMEARQMRPEWELVGEWKRQYETREVNLDTPVGADLDILVAPQPSRLSDKQLRNLHDYIWAGRPALLLEDPLPYFAGYELGSSQAKRPPNQMMGMPPNESGEKGDLQPLLKALGLDMKLEQIVWSDFNPSFRFRDLYPRHLVWCYRSKGSILPAPATTGIDSLALPWPGYFEEAPGKNSELTVKPLLKPAEKVGWGHHPYEELVGYNMFQPRGLSTPKRFDPDSKAQAMLAAEITGRMKRAYPFEEQKAPDAAEKKSEEAGKDEKKTEEPAKEPKKEEKGLGQLGEKSVHVILVADADFANDLFFMFSRNPDNELTKEDQKMLADLKNVQFLANAVDALAGDEALMELRTRRAKPRPLDVLEEVQDRTQNAYRAAQTKAQDEAKAKIDKLNAEFQERYKKIEEDKEQDENTKAQAIARVKASSQRQLELGIDEINAQKDRQDREAKITQQREIETARREVRWKSMGIPAVVLFFLALGVFLNRLRGERLIVPESRKRSDA